MISEKIYRALLAVYPREHRREYGELMVQLFRDRMRHEGGGFRRLVVWTQMISDLAGSAFEEHKEREDMKKRMWIVAASLVALMIVAVGASVVLSQSEDRVKIRVFVQKDSNTFSGEGENGLSDALSQAVEEGAMTRESADMVKMSFVELPVGKALSSDDVGMSDPKFRVWSDSNEFSLDVEGRDGLAEALRQSVADGEISQKMADEILAVLLSGENEISQEIENEIQTLLSDENTGS